MGDIRSYHKILILILAILLCLSLAVVIYFATAEQKTAVVAKTEETLENPDSTGKLRVKMNTYMNIADGTLQNIGFYNLNENRLLKLKVTVDGETVYESGYIDEGEVLQADIIDETSLPKGETEALAEIYSYSTDKEFIGQRNVEITLNKG